MRFPFSVKFEANLEGNEICLAAQYTNPKLICLKFHVENESLENAGVMMASDLPAARRNLAHFMIIAAQCTYHKLICVKFQFKNESR